MKPNSWSTWLENAHVCKINEKIILILVDYNRQIYIHFILFKIQGILCNSKVLLGLFILFERWPKIEHFVEKNFLTTF